MGPSRERAGLVIVVHGEIPWIMIVIIKNDELIVDCLRFSRSPCVFRPGADHSRFIAAVVFGRDSSFYSSASQTSFRAVASTK